MDTVEVSSVGKKIAAARTKLILDKPFLGALVLRLGLKPSSASWCKTIGTDTKHIYYNPTYIDALTSVELQFVLSHEALHCALSHFTRRQSRVRHRWDLACDYAINPILLDEGLKPPPDVMVLEEYRDMTAEQIYPCLSDNDHSETMDQHLYGRQHNDSQTDSDDTEHKAHTEPGIGEFNPRESKPAEINPTENRPAKLKPAEMMQLQERWQQRLVAARQQAMTAGKMSSALQRTVSVQSKPALSWRAVLANYLSLTGRDDYSYARPSSRRGDPAIFPRLQSAAINLVVALDVSGSISDAEIGDCVAEINAIKGQLRAHITLFACDLKVAKGFPKEFHAWQEIRFEATIAGGGSTDFRPVFDAVKLHDFMPDVILYFTDGLGRYPSVMPPYPVIWLIKGKASVPWGQRIQLT